MKMSVKTILFRLISLSLLIAALYGAGRLYFHLTGGFTLANISSDFSFNPEWEVRPLAKEEKERLTQALDQPYYYLGKGCQSYVFLSKDGRYVIKFFKYQRFRMQPWLVYFPPLPAIVKYREEKMEKKWGKLDSFVKSWKVAFENLRDETGLIFVHLNKTTDLQKRLTIYDKIGYSHQIDLDQMEFCIQNRAYMLCDVLLELKEKGDLQGAKQLINDLLGLILSEYHRGLADNDHALMQNTGVAQGKPIHIDVGQFVQNEAIKNPTVYHQELYTKMYKFKLWLKDSYPELADFLEERLAEIIGPSYGTMQPKFRPK
ncbi:hypothetical protein [Candidatus Protochlamydia phocaeensis]|uniref:hypothetical protein n=1 Tax=Candidatus Protochlamydia phocaeensis TaxID=1414722 RepID=UPI000837D4D1|nr:hypothetical protein [Candidatus Protochlamydia phocaeensis]